MHEIKVDPYGIRIMVPKGITYAVRINSLSCIAANILKQEMLSLGAEVAVSRDTLTGRTRKTECLLMGSLSQLQRLNEKLNKQPFGLNRLAKELNESVAKYQKDSFIIDLGRYKLELKPGKARLMGIANITSDSFSGDGLYQKSNIKNQISKIIDYIEKMIRDGADIVDIGGESSRPGARPVPVKEELSRTIPVIKALAKKIKVPISIDTYKPEVARAALDNGAAIVNDISGLRNPKMRKVIAKHKAAVIIMHMKGNPRSMQKRPRYRSLINEITEYLDSAINSGIASGIDREKIIIDPGIGFGKTVEHNLEILRRLKEFKILGRPIMVGPSRKSFIGEILNAGPEARIFGTVSACLLAVKNGAHILRVHDVKELRQALKVSEAVSNI
jgi:dihydropteroate synthase